MCKKFLECSTRFDNLYVSWICVIEIERFIPCYMSESDPHILSGEVFRIMKELVNDINDCVMMVL